MKNIMKEIIARTDSEKDGYCRIKHKRGWLDFLEDGVDLAIFNLQIDDDEYILDDYDYQQDGYDDFDSDDIGLEDFDLDDDLWME